VRLDPETKIGRLLGAIPSSAVALERLGIIVAGNEDKSLRQLCAETGMNFEEFLRAMDEIDWEKETPHPTIPPHPPRATDPPQPTNTTLREEIDGQATSEDRSDTSLTFPNF